MNYRTRSREPKHIDLHIVDALEEKWAWRGLSESAALRYRLRKTRIKIVSHYCWDVPSLQAVIQDIISHRSCYAYPRRCVPYLHIASHGSVDGLALGDSKPLPWTVLSKCLLPLQRRIDFTLPISLSSCWGFYGYKLSSESMKEYEKKQAFHSLVGPRGKLCTAELFDSFAEFYRCLLHRFTSPPEAIARANRSIKDKASYLEFVPGERYTSN